MGDIKTMAERGEAPPPDARLAVTAERSIETRGTASHAETKSPPPSDLATRASTSLGATTETGARGAPASIDVGDSDVEMDAAPPVAQSSSASAATAGESSPSDEYD